MKRPLSYVRTAQRLLKTSPNGIVSAGQVAYVAHRHTCNVAAHDFPAECAIADSGKFQRVGFINGNSMGISEWRSL